MIGKAGDEDAAAGVVEGLGELPSPASVQPGRTNHVRECGRNIGGNSISAIAGRATGGSGVGTRVCARELTPRSVRLYPGSRGMFSSLPMGHVRRV